MSATVPVPMEWHWCLGFVVSLLTAVFTLMSAGIVRRLFILIMGLISVMGFSLSCVLWDVMWLAHLELVSLVWAWLCAVVYAAQHKMPCDERDLVIRKERVELEVKF